MNIMIDNFGPWLSVLLDAAVKGAVVLAVAIAASLAMRKRSAAGRHVVWAMAMAGIVCLPILSIALPNWRLPILPATPKPLAASQQTPAAPAAPAAPASSDRSSAPDRSPEPLATSQHPPVVPITPDRSPEPPAPLATSQHTPVAPGASDRSPASPHQPLAVSPRTPGSPTAKDTRGTGVPAWAIWVLLAWGAGTLAVLAPLVIGSICVWRLARSASPLADGSWASLLREQARRLGLRRQVRLLQSRRATMPITWGLFRPKVLLPAEADDWSPERRRIVLIHELAHVKRWDCLTQLVAQLACVAHWFNPLAWFAIRRLRIERERACDDLVLAGGSKASDYADELLAMARSLRSPARAPLAAVAMARRSHFEGRLLAILDADRPRRALTRGTLLVSLAIAAALCLPLAAVRCTPRPSKPADKTANAAKADEKSPATKPAMQVSLPQPTQPGVLVAKFSCGVQVELLAVSEHVMHKPKKDRKWWRPDGNNMAEGLYEFLYGGLSGDGRQFREFVFRITGTSARELGLRQEVPGFKSMGQLKHPVREGKEVEGLKILTVGLKPNLSTVDIRFGVASGKWETDAWRKGIGAYTKCSVILGRPIESKGGVCVSASDLDLDKQRRIIAIDKAGKTHVGKEIDSGSVRGGEKGTRLTTVRFEKLAMKDLVEVRFQVRSFKWATFKNVSLKPGHRTEASVEPPSKSPDKQPPTTTRPSSSQAQPVGSLNIPAGRVVMAIPIDPAQPGLDRLRVGDLVDLFGKFAVRGKPVKSYWMLKAVRVHSIGGRAVTTRPAGVTARSRSASIAVDRKIALKLSNLLTHAKGKPRLVIRSPKAAALPDAGKINPELQSLARPPTTQPATTAVRYGS